MRERKFIAAIRRYDWASAERLADSVEVTLKTFPACSYYAGDEGEGRHDGNGCAFSPTRLAHVSGMVALLSHLLHMSLEWLRCCLISSQEHLISSQEHDDITASRARVAWMQYYITAGEWSKALGQAINEAERESIKVTKEAA